MFVEIMFIDEVQSLIHYRIDILPNTSVGDAIKQTDLPTRYPDILNHSMGIFSKKVSPVTILKAGDRLEIYRPLLVDPMERRRQKAKKVSKGAV